MQQVEPPGAGVAAAPSIRSPLATAGAAQRSIVDARVVVVSALSVLVAIVSGFIAQGLTRLIAGFTNLAFFGRLSFAQVSPAHNRLGLFVILIPTIGGLVVGLMARYGSKAIRGHGIPEAMEQVLTNESRIPARMTFLKPLSAAISIGTGGPFGAEGPIIATGGALGSLLGQVIRTTANERKALLAAGAAAGMAATFGTPVAAVLLAVELLLFEYRARSLVPVALAAVAATGVRLAFLGTAPAFAMPVVAQPGEAALALYVGIGAILGVGSVLVTQAVYAVEDLFERLPMHWMWWPALGGTAVGAVGYVAPETLGVGYDNIDALLSGTLATGALLALTCFKFASWSIALGSGTSGGTLAPLFTIGGGCGALLGVLAAALAPEAGVDPRIAALVGMASMFAGASRALLASAVFAFETTRQPISLLPLLGGCSAAFLASSLLMRNSIMTEKIARRGVRVLGEYSADFLEQLSVVSRASPAVTTLGIGDSIGAIRRFFASGMSGSQHQGYPVVDAAGHLVAFVTRKDLASLPEHLTLGDLDLRPPVVIFGDASLREAADLMAKRRIGRLPVVSREQPAIVSGMITRSDLVEAHAPRLRDHELAPGLLRRRSDRPGRRHA